MLDRLRDIWQSAALLRAVVICTCSFSVPISAPAQSVGGDVFIRNEAGNQIKLYEKSFALVIGIDDYGSGWPRLKSAVSDAQTVAKALGAQGFKVDLKENLKGSSLKEAIESWFLFAGLQPNARLVVWFAGHGKTVQAGTYLISADAPNPNDATDADRQQIYGNFFRATVPLSEFNRYMKESTARHVLVIFDACFAGEIFSATRSAPPTISRDTSLPARQFITSGVAGQTVSDDGKFADFFVRAISDPKSGADQNHDGYVTANELGLFLKQAITDDSRGRQTPDYGPLREGAYDKGDFVFTLPSQDGGSQSTANADKDVALQERIWIFVRDQNDPKITQNFLRSFPDSPYAAVANAQIETTIDPGKVVATKADDERRTAASDSPKVRAVSVLFGTNREANNGRFGSARATNLSIGQASISIPEDHSIGSIETALNVNVLGLTVYQDTVSTTKHFTVLSQQRLNFPLLIIPNDRKAPPSSDDVFIYVHGFNTTFDDALFRAAQLAWDMQFAGTAAVFSWPSQGSVSGYQYDRDSALISRDSLKEFIQAVRSLYHGRIHIIAQSQGVVPVMDVLNVIAQEQVGLPAPIDQVILLSPDMDNDYFQLTCARSLTAVSRITVYASSIDKALRVAASLSNSPRVGSISSDGIPFLSSCADFIDASKATPDSSYSINSTLSSKLVLSDIALLLKNPTLRPDQRLTQIRRVESPKGPFFRYVD